jgi:glyoxylate reductase
MADQPHIIVTRHLPAPVEKRLADSFGAAVNPDDHFFTRDELLAAVAQADILVPTVTDAIDAEIISAAGANLRLLANFGVGVNHIDVAAAAARGIAVTNTPDVLTEDTADLAIGLILMACRGLTGGEREVRAGQWSGWGPTAMMATRVHGKKLGIVGMGRIGAAVARRARGFGMEVHYHNRSPVAAALEAELAATHWPDLDAMLSEMDVVSINCPQTEDTFHLFSAERLKRMRSSAFLINTARGGIIDEAALVVALDDGTIAGAGLDVYEGEPTVHPGLLALENVVLLPHLGSATVDGRIAMGDRVIDNIEAYLAGTELPDRVGSA